MMEIVFMDFVLQPFLYLIFFIPSSFFFFFFFLFLLMNNKGARPTRWRRWRAFSRQGR